MAILTEQESKKIIDKVLSYSKADETTVTITGGRVGNIRYARNTISTTGETDDLSFEVTAVFGKKSGSSSSNEFTDDAIKKAVKTAEEIAGFAPENPEYVSLLGPQQYQPSHTWAKDASAITPGFRADAALNSMKPCIDKNLVAAGYLEDTIGFTAIGNSKGLFGYNKEASINFSVTVRTKDERGSGLGTQYITEASMLNTKAATEIAMQKAVASAEVIEMPTGKYTVILEPYALGVQSFIPFFIQSMDARNADEGRSFFSKKGGGTKVGEKLFNEQLIIESDPFNSLVPASPFVADGRPTEKTIWVEKGVLKNLFYSRYWAQNKGVKATPAPSNVIITGGNQTLEELIKNSDKTILITATHYMRMVDPQRILITGLTRNGLFYIENGVIKHAVKNFRFNESPINMFNNLEALGKPIRINNNLIPPMKVKAFTFTSISDAV